MSYRTGRIAAGIVLAMLACNLTLAADNPRDGVFIHITHAQDDPHRVLMALNMAKLMCEDHDVLVYFDVQGVNVVLEDAEAISYSHFPDSKQQIKQLPQHGVILMACPGCLKAAGKTAEDLAPGVRVAEKDVFFSFTKGRILSLDY